LASSKKVNLVKVMAQKFGCGSYAVQCMVAHGSVTIDGHTVQPGWLRVLTEEQVYGRMLKCPRGEARLIGSRLVEDYEQLKLAGRC
jgi:hypothetical protein